MANVVKPVVDAVTINNVNVAVDCVWLKCVQSFEFNWAMESIPINCDPEFGPITYLRANPTGSISIEAMNHNSTSLQYALDATVEDVDTPSATCVKISGIQWTPDDEATPTEWTAIVRLNNINIDNVEVFTDDACTVPWNDTTPLNVITVTSDCYGLVTLTTDDVDSTEDTLYFTYDYLVDFPTDATIIRPSFSTFAADHTVVAWTRNSTSGLYEVYVFPRVQITPDFTLRFDNTTSIKTIPIRMVVLSDPDFNPDNPLGYIVITDELPTVLSNIIG